MSGTRVKPTPAYLEECEEDSELPMAGTKISASAPRTPNEPEARKPLQSGSPQTSSDDGHGSPSRISRRERRESRASRHRGATRERSYERVREQSEHRESKEKRRERVARRSSVHRPSKEHRNSVSYHDDSPHDQQLTRTRSHSNRTPFNPTMAPPPAQYPPPPQPTNYYGHPGQMMPPPLPPNNMFPPPPNMNMPPNMNLGPGGMPGHMGLPMPMHPGTPQMMPPPMPNGPVNGYAFPPQNYAMSGMPHTPGSDYHEMQSAQNQRLSQRLGPARPVSAMAIRRDSHHYDEHPDLLGHASGSTVRRPSVRRRDGDDERRRAFEDDKRKMPPPGNVPMRPKSARPVSGAYSRPIPIERSHLRNRSSVYEEDDLDYDGYYPPGSPEHDDYITAGTRARRESLNYGNGRMVPHRTRRPSSYYQEAPLSSSLNDSNYETQAKTAQAYMNLTNSIKTLELTDESLRKVNRANHAGSSRSTRSGGSRGDDSEWRQPSVTTQTTRSSDEEFTIKVRGGEAFVNIDGQDIKCRDGTELTITSSRPLSIRSPNEGPQRLALEAPPGSYYDSHHERDRMVRAERIPQRHRANSQANSFSRGSLDRHYDAPIYNYGGGGRF